MKKKIFGFILPVLLLAVVFSLTCCKKDDNSIPYAYVDFYVYINQPPFTSLNAVGNWVYVTGGVKGIIVFRKNISEFAAYDRSCPYDPGSGNARLEVDSSNIICVDRNCGSKFNLMDNTILNGPATRSMRTYVADYEPSANRVHVHN